MTKRDLGAVRGWMWLVIFLVVLGGAEMVAAVMITHHLLPAKPAIAVDAVVNWTLVAMYAFASPLWGSPEIHEGGLVVKFGLVGAVRAPMEAIRGASVFNAPMMAPWELGAGFDKDSRRISLVRSTTAESVLVRFRIPVVSRVQLDQTVLATSLVLTTSDAGALAADISTLVAMHEAKP